MKFLRQTLQKRVLPGKAIKLPQIDLQTQHPVNGRCEERFRLRCQSGARRCNVQFRSGGRAGLGNRNLYGLVLENEYSSIGLAVPAVPEVIGSPA